MGPAEASGHCGATALAERRASARGTAAMTAAAISFLPDECRHMRSGFTHHSERKYC